MKISQIEIPAMPPKDLVANVLATPDMPLPILKQITQAPHFAADGSLQTAPGYHEPSQTLYLPVEGFEVPAVPEIPTAEEVDAARRLIVDDLLGDFPHVDAASIAHSTALLLLPLVRNMIDGATPFHLISKPSPGTGATLLIWALSYPALGHDLTTMTEAGDESEWRKRLTSTLKNAPQLVAIDNLVNRLDSPALASAITSRTWGDRLLGSNQMVEIPVRTGWIGTGNNPTVSAEIARRIVSIRLDAKQDRPWMRDGFRHADLRGWVTANRGRLVAAALTLVRAWLADGRPPGTRIFGMFESWSKTMGGILSVAGIPGFLDNLQAFYEVADVESATWRSFVGLWWSQHQTAPVLTNDLLAVANGESCLNLGTGGEQSQKIRLGKMLADKRDRIFDIELMDQSVVRLRIDQSGMKQRAMIWQLTKVE